MPLTPEEVKELRAQLSEQIQNLPHQQKEAAQRQIDSLSSEALESMLKQQKSSKPEKGIFRSIIDKEIKSFIVAENKDAIAVLDIKPVSKSHVIIIPKTPVIDSKSIPNSCFSLAKRITKKVSKTFKSKSSEIQTEYKFGEMIINVIPIYDKSLNLNSPRYDATEKELEEVESKIKIIKKQRIKRIKIMKKTQTAGSALKLPRRIA